MKHFIQTTACIVLMATPALAQQADNSRYGEKGYVAEQSVVKVRTRHGTPEDHYKGVKSNYPVRDRVRYSDYQCPPNFSGMFRGTSYCVNGVLMQ